MHGLSFLLGGLAAVILLLLMGDAVKQTWTPADLPVGPPAPTARALVAAGVDPGRVYIIAYGAGLASGSKGAGRMVRVGIRAKTP